jgi:hypothetical protein
MANPEHLAILKQGVTAIPFGFVKPKSRLAGQLKKAQRLGAG